jgi:hypothetical protein
MRRPKATWVSDLGDMGVAFDGMKKNTSCVGC